MAQQPRHFTRDPAMSADIADAFGGGGSHADELIEANQARVPQELHEANLHPVDHDATKELERKDVVAASGFKDAEVLSYARRGAFATFVYAKNDRVEKGVLLIDEDGKLSNVDEQDTPDRAQLRAQVEARQTIAEAQAEGDRIVAEAREEAQKKMAEAAEEASKRQSEGQEEAAKLEAEDAEDDCEPKGEPKGDSKPKGGGDPKDDCDDGDPAPGSAEPAKSRAKGR